MFFWIWYFELEDIVKSLFPSFSAVPVTHRYSSFTMDCIRGLWWCCVVGSGNEWIVKEYAQAGVRDTRLLRTT